MWDYYWCCALLFREVDVVLLLLEIMNVLSVVVSRSISLSAAGTENMLCLFVLHDANSRLL